MIWKNWREQGRKLPHLRIQRAMKCGGKMVTVVQGKPESSQHKEIKENFTKEDEVCEGFADDRL